MASILVVDDELDGCEPLVKYLARSGHVTRCVPNGREALAALANRTPDVVVLDLRMPEMDGITFLEVIRCYLRWSFLPTIVLTALPPGPTTERAETLGVKRIFHKASYKLSEILDAVNELTGHEGQASPSVC